MKEKNYSALAGRRTNIKFPGLSGFPSLREPRFAVAVPFVTPAPTGKVQMLLNRHHWQLSQG